MERNILCQGIHPGQERKSSCALMLPLKDTDSFLHPPLIERPIVNLSGSLQNNCEVSDFSEPQIKL